MHELKCFASVLSIFTETTSLMKIYRLKFNISKTDRCIEKLILKDLNNDINTVGLARINRRHFCNRGAIF